MQHIIEGFLSFQKEIFPQRKGPFRSLTSGQNPKTLSISCPDNRLIPELATQQDPGQLLIIHNADNIVPSFGPKPGDVSAAIEYAVVTLGVMNIVICGHSNCGAMRAITDSQPLNPMPATVHWLYYADAVKAMVDKETWDNPIDKVNATVEESVIVQLDSVETHPCVTVGLHNNAFCLHGWVYDIESGEIRTLDKDNRTYVSLVNSPQVHFEQFPHWDRDAPDTSSPYFCQ